LNEHVQLSTDEKLNITNRVIVNTSQQLRLSNSDYKSTITAEHRNENIWETERKCEKGRESQR